MMEKKHGARLQLRALEPEDLDFLYSIENDAELWDYGCANVPYSRLSLSNYILGSTCDIYADRQMRLLMEDDGGNAVGLIDIFHFEPRHLRAEVGVVVARKYRHLGYAHEALCQIIAYGRHTLHLHQLYAVVDAGNIDSKKLFEGVGFQVKATLKDWLQGEKCYTDALIMQIFL